MRSFRRYGWVRCIRPECSRSGIGVLVVVVVIYWLISFLLLKTKLRGVWAALLSLAIAFVIIGVFVGICVLVENAVVA